VSKDSGFTVFITNNARVYQVKIVLFTLGDIEIKVWCYKKAVTGVSTSIYTASNRPIYCSKRGSVKIVNREHFPAYKGHLNEVTYIEPDNFTVFSEDGNWVK
jgi:hypothetical protein